MKCAVLIAYILLGSIIIGRDCIIRLSFANLTVGDQIKVKGYDNCDTHRWHTEIIVDINHETYQILTNHGNRFVMRDFWKGTVKF